MGRRRKGGREGGGEEGRGTPRPRGMISCVSCSTVMVVSPLLRMSSAAERGRKRTCDRGVRGAVRWGSRGCTPMVCSFKLSLQPQSMSFWRKCSLSL